MLVTPAVLHDIRKHGKTAYPEEGCGFLLGSVTDDGRNHVTRARRVANRKTEDRERRYEISPEDYRDAQQAADAVGLDIVGFYHSHPDHPADPSPTDLAEATFPGYTYVIVSVRDGTPGNLTAWSLRPDRSAFDSEDIDIVQPTINRPADNTPLRTP